MSNPFMINTAIDHGTCNSAIAVMEARGPRVVEPYPNQATMPSVVFVHAGANRVLVGRDARQTMFGGKVRGDGAKEYKTTLMNDTEIPFPGSGTSKRNWEVASLVLRELRTLYVNETNYQPPLAVVITVPAEFPNPACMATIRAAEAAGFLQVELLAEQIAAATAYGFHNRIEPGHFLVFDIGAGTTDVSLLHGHGGKVALVEGAHVGDLNLGGGKLDKILKTHVLTKAGLKSADFEAGMEDMALLRVEELKIALSTQESASVEIFSRRDSTESKRVAVTRAEYEDLIRVLLGQAVQLATGLLAKFELKPSDIVGVILVGGPTKTPLMRRLLESAFGNDRILDRIDPMTAVVQGAAVHASTCRKSDAVLRKEGLDVVSPGAVSRVRFAYQPTSESTRCVVGVTVEGPAVKEGGLTVEMAEKTEGGFKSERVPVDADGAATVELVLRAKESDKGALFEFKTEVRDRDGRCLKTENQPQIRFGLRKIVDQLSNSLGIGLRSDQVYFHGLKSSQFEAVFKPGALLPTPAERVRVVTSAALERGKVGVALVVPVVEGLKNHFQSEEQDTLCNRTIGELRIEATDPRVSRSIPAGTSVDLTLSCDSSRRVTVSAYVEFLKEEFAVTLALDGYPLNFVLTKQLFRCTKIALDRIRRIHTRNPNPSVAEGLVLLGKHRYVEQVQDECDALEGAGDHRDSGELAVFYERVHRLAGTITELRRRQAREQAATLVESLAPSLKGEQSHTFAELRQAFVKATEAGDENTTNGILAELEGLDREVRCDPYYTVCFSVQAIGNSNPKVSKAQGDLFRRADGAWDDVIANGGVQSLTDEDIARFRVLDKELDEAFPELPQWRDELRKQPRDVLTKKAP